VTSPSIRVQSGYDKNEKFCGESGEILYEVNKNHVKLSLDLANLKSERQYQIDWRNNDVRGFAIGAFSTNNSGAIRDGSLKMFRAGEVRGIGILIYYLVGYDPAGLRRFNPC